MPFVRLKTRVPGPRSQALTEKRRQAIPRGISELTPIFVRRAEGALLEDVDGNRFLDLAGGIGCANAGHCAPAVVEAVERQAERFLHLCFMVTGYEGYLSVAERLNRLAPGVSAKKTILLNSGAEAVENAIKIARAYTRRPAVICFEDAFHGRTFMAMTLTSKVHPYKAGFEPLAGDVYRVPYGYCYRCSYSLRYPGCELHCARALEEAFERLVAAESVAAIIAEPVLGEGGFVVPPPEFFPILRETCDRHGILLIADEVQTGFGRTGRMFACEHFDVEPDLLVTAKSLGGGLPLAAVTGKSEIMDSSPPGALGGTFGGNALACEAALAAMDVMEQGKLCGRAVELGKRFRNRAIEWQRTFSLVGDVRGLGAMQAIELVRDRESRLPASEETKQVIRFCYQHGVIVLMAGTYDNVIRVLMPLVMTDAQLDEALDVLEQSLQAVGKGQPRPAEVI